MKLGKNASGKTTVKMSKSEWLDFGKKAGWTKKALGEDVMMTPSGQPAAPQGDYDVVGTQAISAGVAVKALQELGWIRDDSSGKTVMKQP